MVGIVGTIAAVVSVCIYVDVVASVAADTTTVVDIVVIFYHYVCNLFVFIYTCITLTYS